MAVTVAPTGSSNDTPTLQAAINGTITEPDPDDAEATITRARKWSEWKSPNHEHQLISGNYYIPSTSWGVHMTAKQWFGFVLGGLVTVVLKRPVVEVAPE